MLILNRVPHAHSVWHPLLFKGDKQLARRRFYKSLPEATYRAYFREHAARELFHKDFTTHWLDTNWLVKFRQSG